MRKILSAIAALGISAVTGSAFADTPFSLHFEPTVAIPTTRPQSATYGAGPDLEVKGLFALDHHWLVGPAVSALYLPRATDTGRNAGVLWQIGPSVRFQSDREDLARRVAAGRFYTDISPWVDLDLMMAVTGHVVDPALNLGLGFESPLNKNRTVWMGPLVRYTHVFQSQPSADGVTLDRRDVNIIQAGVSFSWEMPTKTHTVVVEKKVVKREVVQLPAKEVVVVKEVVKQVPSLEINEKVYFDVNKATLRWESRDKLDAVVHKINAQPAMKIMVWGNASSDGPLAWNNKLAKDRTKAVVAYLIKHGVDPKRLVAKSEGVAQPAAPNKTLEGRERNRRVEFNIFFSGVKQ